MIRYLVEEAGADLAIADENGTTPLFVAVVHGHLPVVRYFVENGANFNGETIDIRSKPFLAAVMTGHMSIVQYFVEVLGVDVNSPSNDSCLHIAQIAGHVELITYLIEKGAIDSEM